MIMAAGPPLVAIFQLYPVPPSPLAPMMTMAHHHQTKQHGHIGSAMGLLMHSWKQYVSQLPIRPAVVDIFGSNNCFAITDLKVMV